MTDKISLKLEVKDKEAFIADLKAGKIAIGDLRKAVVEADATSRMTAGDMGGLGMLSKVGRLAGLALAGTALAVGATGVAVAAFGVKAASSNEQATIGFTTMLGSAQKAGAFMQQLSDFAIITPFQLDQLRQTASMMLGMGFNAREIIPDLTAVGDAMSGMGRGADDVNGVLMALGQMKAHGVADAGDLLQLTSRGINSWQIMADTMGKSIPQIQKMVSKGIIPANDAIRMIVDGMEKGTAHTQKFGGMMAKQANSLSGIWSNTVDAASRASGILMAPLFPTLKSGLGHVNAAIPAAQGRLNTYGGSVMNGLKSGDSFGAAVSIDAMIGGGGKTTRGITAAIDTGKNLAAIWRDSVYPAVKLAASAFLPLVIVLQHSADITGFLADHSGTLGATLKTLVVVVGTYKTLAFGINAVLKTQAAVTGILNVLKLKETATTNAQRVAFVLYKGVMLAWQAGVKVWTALQWAWNIAWEANPIGMVIVAIGILIALVMLAWNKFPMFRAAVEGAMHYGAVAISWVWDKLKAFWGWISPWIGKLGGLLSGAWDGLKSGFKSVLNWIIDKWNGLADSMSFTIPGTSVGMTFPHMNKLGAGGTLTSDGSVIVGDRGRPELLNLPKGASVTPLPKTSSATGGGGRRVIEIPVILNGREIARASSEGMDDLMALL